jgi:hypothetical protein
MYQMPGDPGIQPAVRLGCGAVFAAPGRAPGLSGQRSQTRGAYPILGHARMGCRHFARAAGSSGMVRFP